MLRFNAVVTKKLAGATFPMKKVLQKNIKDTSWSNLELNVDSLK
jgi:hypothetical protein